MLSKIKSLFSKKAKEEEPEIITLKQKELKGFLDNKVKEKNESLEKEIGSIREQAKKGREKIKDSKTKLEKAELHNPDIPVKAKQFMEGNRNAYIRKVEEILHQFKIPEEINKIPEFIDEFKEKIEEFLRSTQKSYQVLQEFFSHESGELAHHIRGMEKVVNHLKSIMDKSEMDTVSEILKKEEDLDNLVNNDKDLAKEILEKKAELEEKKKQLKETVIGIDKILMSEDYKEIKDKKKKIISINNQLKEIESEILNRFSVIEKGLKKYSKIALEKGEVIKKYLENPFSALKNDHDLEILSVLEKLESNVKSGSVELNEKKQKKTLLQIKELKKEKLEKIKSESNDLLEKSKKLAQEIKDDDTNKKFIMLTDKKENLEKDIERVESRTKEISEQNNTEQIQNLKNEICEKIKEVFNTDIEIS